MIVAWIVKCDKCGKWVDAKEDAYYSRDSDSLDCCKSCYDSLDKYAQTFIIETGGGR